MLCEFAFFFSKNSRLQSYPIFFNCNKKIRPENSDGLHLLISCSGDAKYCIFAMRKRTFLPDFHAVLGVNIEFGIGLDIESLVPIVALCHAAVHAEVVG